jgi:NTP pyrophosphatase (non-canonical NTP hydrolase)
MSINNLTQNDVDFVSEQASSRYNVFDLYQETATKSAIYPGQGTPLGLAYVALKMNGEAGEFAEHVGKAMRDENLIPVEPVTSGSFHGAMAVISNDLTSSRRELLIKEIGDVLWYLSAACNELGISLSDAAVTNLRKLADRSERGKLQGSGDDR